MLIRCIGTYVDKNNNIIQLISSVFNFLFLIFSLILDIPGVDVIAGITGVVQGSEDGTTLMGRPFLGANFWFVDVEATMDFDDQGVSRGGLGFGFRSLVALRFGPFAYHPLLHFQLPGLFSGDSSVVTSLGAAITIE